MISKLCSLFSVNPHVLNDIQVALNPCSQLLALKESKRRSLSSVGHIATGYITIAPNPQSSSPFERHYDHSLAQIHRSGTQIHRSGTQFRGHSGPRNKTTDLLARLRSFMREACFKRHPVILADFSQHDLSLCLPAFRPTDASKFHSKDAGMHLREKKIKRVSA